MFPSKNKTVYLFLIILSSLLISTVIFAVDKRDLPSAQKANFGPRDISTQNEVNGFSKPSRWGSDDTIATGPVYQGISSDYDTSGNLYAVRCSTYIDSTNACVNVYKSTDGGASWFNLCAFASGWGFKYSYPVVLTGSLGNKLYIFYLRATSNGDIKMTRFTQGGTFEEFCDVKVNADTITYFSACTDDGSHLMVAYQKEEGWHRLYTITSTDSGKTWGNEVLVCSDGAHPDITYGSNGYVYVVFESTGMTKGKSADEDKEIWFRRNPDYCAPGSWEVMEILTDDSYEDSYPKVAALHTIPESTACVWVAYNHESAGEDTLKYDDGTGYYVLPIPNAWEVDLFNVRFTPSSGYSLKSAQFLFYRKAGTGGIRVYVWADTSGFPAQKIDSVDVPDANIQLFPNWTTVDFSSKNTTLNKVTDFHIGYTLLGPPSTDSVSILSDDGEPVGTEHRSIDSDYGTWETMYSWFGHDVNFMIRADVERMQSTDLRFAYSTNSGKNWTKDQVLADDPSADEMAADLKAYRSSTNQYVDLCYVKYSGVVKSGSDVYYTWAASYDPGEFFSPHQIINEHWANWSPDGREDCQLTYPNPDWFPGIVYAGAPLKKDDKKNLDFGGWDLYYDFHDWTDVEEETAEEKLPAEFSLSNNYPNPFNPETKIGYFIPRACPVKLEVFNILGQRVRTLVDEVQTAGKKEVIWDGRDENRNEVASGVYFYKLEAKNFSQTKKMVLMK
jgi:hypothetical protein